MSAGVDEEVEFSFLAEDTEKETEEPEFSFLDAEDKKEEPKVVEQENQSTPIVDQKTETGNVNRTEKASSEARDKRTERTTSSDKSDLKKETNPKDTKPKESTTTSTRQFGIPTPKVKAGKENEAAVILRTFKAKNSKGPKDKVWQTVIDETGNFVAAPKEEKGNEAAAILANFKARNSSAGEDKEWKTAIDSTGEFVSTKKANEENKAAEILKNFKEKNKRKQTEELRKSEVEQDVPETPVIEEPKEVTTLNDEENKAAEAEVKPTAKTGGGCCVVS